MPGTAGRIGSYGPARRAALAAAIACTLAACGAGPGTSRDPRWAEPLDLPGLPNLHRVDEGLYRSAQPEPEGFAALRGLGVRTVVDLRQDHSDQGAVRAAGLAGDAFDLVAIPMSPRGISEEQLLAFLRVAADPARRPVLVHCRHGADRTGAAVAAYRAVIQGWSQEEAVAEMRGGGFGHHRIWRDLQDDVLALDAGSLRRALGR